MSQQPQLLSPSNGKKKKLVSSGSPNSKRNSVRDSHNSHNSHKMTKIKAHKKELQRIRKLRKGGKQKAVRTLSQHLSERQSGREESHTYAFWETGTDTQVKDGENIKKLSVLTQYVAELEEIEKHSCWAKFVENTLQNWLILPDSVFKVVWDWMIIFFVLYCCFMIPFKISFYRDYGTSVFVFNHVVNALLFVDMFFSFRTAYVDHRQNIVVDAKLIGAMYLRSRFWLDFFATVPFDVVAHMLGLEARADDLVSLLGLLRIRKVISNARLDGSVWNTPMMRIGKLVVGFYILAHWFACMFYWVGIMQPGADTESWIVKQGLEEAGWQELYVVSLYWAYVTMMTVGYGDVHAYTYYERILNVPILIIATVTYATIFGSVEYTVETMSATFRKYQSRIDTVAEFNSLFELSPELSTKLNDYTIEIFHQTKGFDMDQMLGALPRSVKADILFHIHHNIIETVPLFEGVTENFVEEMILKLKSMVCLADDYVFRQDDNSKEMYFLRVGIVEVELSGQVVGDFGPGSHFGEVAMLLGHRRPSSIRAVTKCELSYITQDDFADLLFMFPEYEENVRVKARTHVLHDVIEQDGEPETSVSRARHEMIFRTRTSANNIQKRNSVLNQLDEGKQSLMNIRSSGMLGDASRTVQDDIPKPIGQESMDYTDEFTDEFLLGDKSAPVPLGSMEPAMVQTSSPEVKERKLDGTVDQGKLGEEDQKNNNKYQRAFMANKSWGIIAAIFGNNKKKIENQTGQQVISILKQGGRIGVEERQGKVVLLPGSKQTSPAESRLGKSERPSPKSSYNRQPGHGSRPVSRLGPSSKEFEDSYDDRISKPGSVFDKLHGMRSGGGRGPRVEEKDVGDLKVSMIEMEKRLESKFRPQMNAINNKIDAILAACEQVFSAGAAEGTAGAATAAEKGATVGGRAAATKGTGEAEFENFTWRKNVIEEASGAGAGAGVGGPTRLSREVVFIPSLLSPAPQPQKAAEVERQVSMSSKSRVMNAAGMMFYEGDNLPGNVNIDAPRRTSLPSSHNARPDAPRQTSLTPSRNVSRASLANRDT